MLGSFRLGNHRSFRDEQELLLMPAGPADDRPVVPVAAVYGANASGKSNLLDGLSFMRFEMLRSFARADAGDGIVRHPFRLSSSESDRLSVFVVELVAEGVPYTYGFSIDDAEIREEWLYSFPEKRKRMIFDREHHEIKFGSTVADLKSKMEVLEDLLRPNTLFISACAGLTLDPLESFGNS